MPHYRCVACKTRMHSASTLPEQVGDLCPECGSLLEPVAEPADVIGFRLITLRESAPDGEAPGTHQRLAARVLDFLDRREMGQAQLDAERWGDKGDGLRAEAVALPHPDAY